MSLLHIATLNRNFNIIQLLLNRNCININHLFKEITKIEGKKHIEKSALHITLENNDSEIVKLLLNHRKLLTTSINIDTCKY